MVILSSVLVLSLIPLSRIPLSALLPNAEEGQNSTITLKERRDNESIPARKTTQSYYDRLLVKRHETPFRVDLITAYAPARGFRGALGPLAAYWFPDYGNIYIVSDDIEEHQDLRTCFRNSCASAKHLPKVIGNSFLNSTAARDMLKNWGNNKRAQNIMKRVWKFFLDRDVSAEILGFFDDDACMLDHVLPGEIITSENRLVVRGFSRTNRWIRGNRILDLPLPADFMHEFPVFVYRDMLVDFREYVLEKAKTKSTLKKACSNMDDDDQIFTRVLLYLAGGAWGEYHLLLGFAYQSAKWKDRYEWQLSDPKVQTRAIMGMSRHIHGTGSCSGPLEPAWNRDETFWQRHARLSIYPGTLNENPRWDFSRPCALEPTQVKKKRKQILSKTDACIVPNIDEWLMYMQNRETLLQMVANESSSYWGVCGEDIGAKWTTCLNAKKHDH